MEMRAETALSGSKMDDFQSGGDRKVRMAASKMDDFKRRI
jgi:hypothetical protein